MPENVPVLRRLNAGKWYQRLPCDPAPADLARRLAEANVASKAAKRIDTYERFHHQHREHHRAVVRGVLGAAGLVLSVAPGVPALFSSCRADHGWECGLRVMAMAGGALALTVTGWAFWELYHQPSHLSEHVAKLNAEMARSMQAKNGDVAVERLFDLYRGMSHHEQDELKRYLHERAEQTPVAAASDPVAEEDREGDDDAEGLFEDTMSLSAGNPGWSLEADRAHSLEVGDVPPGALMPPGSPRPWHGVMLRRG